MASTPPANQKSEQGLRRRPALHDGVSRASASLWHRPVDVLLRHLDRAALAVDAILSVDHLDMRRRRRDTGGGVGVTKRCTRPAHKQGRYPYVSFTRQRGNARVVWTAGRPGNNSIGSR